MKARNISLVEHFVDFKRDICLSCIKRSNERQFDDVKILMDLYSTVQEDIRYDTRGRSSLGQTGTTTAKSSYQITQY